MLKLIGLLTVLAAVVLIAGIFFGWWNLSSSDTPDGKTVTFSVDKDEMQEDVEKAKEKLGGLGDDEVEGTIEAVDAENRKMIVRREDGGRLTLALPADVEVSIDGEAAAVAALRPREIVTIRYEEGDGNGRLPTARLIVVMRKG